VIERPGFHQVGARVVPVPDRRLAGRHRLVGHQLVQHLPERGEVVLLDAAVQILPRGPGLRLRTLAMFAPGSKNHYKVSPSLHGGTDMQAVEDRLAIVETVNNWALWRDAGDWERFRTVWHEDGWMTATWFQGPPRKFIEVSKAGFDKGVSILHFLGGTSVDLNGERAIAQTKMTISQRARVDGVLVDVVCTGRFYDFFEQEKEQMGHRAPAADLREGPHGPARSGGEAGAGSRAARALSRGLPAPGLPADEDRLHHQARPAAAEGAGGRRRSTCTARPGSTARPPPSRLDISGQLRIGQPVRRLEDDALLTGAARYIDDLDLPGAVHAAFVRSPHVHARVLSIDAHDALRAPGVLAVYTADDLARRRLGPIQVAVTQRGRDGAPRAALRARVGRRRCASSARRWRSCWRAASARRAIAAERGGRYQSCRMSRSAPHVPARVRSATPQPGDRMGRWRPAGRRIGVRARGPRDAG
jgi:hypothetical protein